MKTIVQDLWKGYDLPLHCWSIYGTRWGRKTSEQITVQSNRWTIAQPSDPCFVSEVHPREREIPPGRLKESSLVLRTTRKEVVAILPLSPLLHILPSTLLPLKNRPVAYMIDMRATTHLVCSPWSLSFEHGTWLLPCRQFFTSMTEQIISLIIAPIPCVLKSRSCVFQLLNSNTHFDQPCSQRTSTNFSRRMPRFMLGSQRVVHLFSQAWCSSSRLRYMPSIDRMSKFGTSHDSRPCNRVCLLDRILTYSGLIRPCRHPSLFPETKLSLLKESWYHHALASYKSSSILNDLKLHGIKPSSFAL